MMRVWIFGAAVALGVSPAFAQPHPCDVPATSGVIVSSTQPVKVRFCIKPTDKVTRLEIVEEGAPPVSFLEAQAVVISGASADGYVQYEVTLGTLDPDGYALVVTAFNRNEFGQEQASDPSAPFGFTVAQPIAKPATPKITGVTQ